MVKCRGSQSVIWRHLGGPETLSGDQEATTIFIINVKMQLALSFPFSLHCTFGKPA